MPDVSVDNTPVTVGLDDGESFTPAPGTTIVGTIQASDGAEVNVEVNGTSVRRVATSQTQNVTSEISVVLTDDTKVVALSSDALITGFKV